MFTNIKQRNIKYDRSCDFFANKAAFCRDKVFVNEHVWKITKFHQGTDPIENPTEIMTLRT